MIDSTSHAFSNLSCDLQKGTSLKITAGRERSLLEVSMFAITLLGTIALNVMTSIITASLVAPCKLSLVLWDGLMFLCCYEWLCSTRALLERKKSPSRSLFLVLLRMMPHGLRLWNIGSLKLGFSPSSAAQNASYQSWLVNPLHWSRLPICSIIIWAPFRLQLGLCCADVLLVFILNQLQPEPSQSTAALWAVLLLRGVFLLLHSRAIEVWMLPALEKWQAEVDGLQQNSSMHTQLPQKSSCSEQFASSSRSSEDMPAAAVRPADTAAFIITSSKKYQNSKDTPEAVSTAAQEEVALMAGLSDPPPPSSIVHSVPPLAQTNESLRQQASCFEQSLSLIHKAALAADAASTGDGADDVPDIIAVLYDNLQALARSEAAAINLSGTKRGLYQSKAVCHEAAVKVTCGDNAHDRVQAAMLQRTAGQVAHILAAAEHLGPNSQRAACVRGCVLLLVWVRHLRSQPSYIAQEDLLLSSSLPHSAAGKAARRASADGSLVRKPAKSFRRASADSVYDNTAASRLCKTVLGSCGDVLGDIDAMRVSTAGTVCSWAASAAPPRTGEDAPMSLRGGTASPGAVEQLPDDTPASAVKGVEHVEPQAAPDAASGSQGEGSNAAPGDSPAGTPHAEASTQEEGPSAVPGDTPAVTPHACSGPITLSGTPEDAEDAGAVMDTFPIVTPSVVQLEPPCFVAGRAGRSSATLRGLPGGDEAVRIMLLDGQCQPVAEEPAAPLEPGPAGDKKAWFSVPALPEGLAYLLLEALGHGCSCAPLLLPVLCLPGAAAEELSQFLREHLAMDPAEKVTGYVPHAAQAGLSPSMQSWQGSIQGLVGDVAYLIESRNPQNGEALSSTGLCQGPAGEVLAAVLMFLAEHSLQSLFAFVVKQLVMPRVGTTAAAAAQTAGGSHAATAAAGASAYEDPSYYSPSYDSPSYDSPSYVSPSYTSPSYDSPSYVSPALAQQGTSRALYGRVVAHAAESSQQDVSKASGKQHPAWAVSADTPARPQSLLHAALFGFRDPEVEARYQRTARRCSTCLAQLCGGLCLLASLTAVHARHWRAANLANLVPNYVLYTVWLVALVMSRSKRAQRRYGWRLAIIITLHVLDLVPTMTMVSLPWGVGGAVAMQVQVHIAHFAAVTFLHQLVKAVVQHRLRPSFIRACLGDCLPMAAALMLLTAHEVQQRKNFIAKGGHVATAEKTKVA